MKRILSTFLLLAVCLLAPAQKRQTMDYDKAWKNVAELAEQRRPESAAQATREILRQATSDGLLGQALKAGLTLANLREEVAPDSLVADTSRLEELGAQCRDEADRAVWHALMSTVYDTWRESGSWRQSDETLDEELRLKADGHRQGVLADMAALAGLPLRDALRPLYRSGADSPRLMGNDVLSLVWRYGVKRDRQGERDNRDALRVLSEMERLYKERGMRDAAVLCRLEALETRLQGCCGTLRLSRKANADSLCALYLSNLDTEAGADVCLRYIDRANLDYAGQDSLAAEALRSWPKSPFANNFKNVQAAARQPELRVTCQRCDTPAMAGEPFVISLRHRNLAEATLRVADAQKNTVLKRTLRFADSGPDYATDTVCVTLPPGHYTATAEAGGKKTSDEFDLSRLRLLTVGLPTGGKTAIVVDAMTGCPIAEAEVTARWDQRKNNKWVEQQQTVSTDAEGRAVLPDKAERASARKGSDVSASVYVRQGVSYRSVGREDTLTRYEVFTDRAIYRPGQTVHVSGLVYTQRGDHMQAAENKEVVVVLRDANYKDVACQTVSTDAWGMAACDFVLPTDRLPGRFSLRFGDGSRTLRVEEYKRPAFEVTFQPVEGKFALGDTVTLRGEVKTYSGVPVSGARVSFRTLRSKSTFFRWWLTLAEAELDEGEITTDDDGRFDIALALMADEDDVNEDETIDEIDMDDFAPDLYNFRVTAQVTDQSGESHDGETTLRAGRVGFALSLDGPDDVDLAKAKNAEFEISALNANGQSVETAGRWTLMGWNAATKAYDRDCGSGTWTSASALSLPARSLATGSLRLRLATTDSAGHAIEAEKTFVVWNSAKASVPLNLQTAFLCQSSKEIDTKHGVDFWFAPHRADAYTYIYIQSADSVQRRELRVLQPRALHIHLDYEPWMGDGVELTVFYASDGTVVQRKATAELRRPDKELKMEWTTFRDRLTPGQQETWTLRVTHTDGTPARAEVMAAMYDASLDAFATHNWRMGLNFYRYVPSLQLRTEFKSPEFYLDVPLEGRSRLQDYTRSWNTLQAYSDYSLGGFVLESKHLDGHVTYARAALMDGAAPEAAPVESALTASGATAENEQAAEAAEAQVRENFAETAFFFPDLLTDAQGNVALRFTLPESLTRWKVMALAHTKGIDFGQLDGTAEARKDFMVQPQMPRFVREGDRLTIATRLVNNGETALTGTVSMTLADAATGRQVYAGQQTFTLPVGETRTATFAYDVPADSAGLLICEVSGRSDRFSDGERNYLPVLSARKTLYETVPFYLTGAEEKTVDLTPLFNGHSETAIHRALTIDYTDNPSWTAVMALHSLALPKADNSNAMAWSASLYANSVAQALASRMPRLQALIQSWKSEQGTDKTLDSELQKNQDLKEVLLQETPWVLDADRETEERARLAELFDTNLQAQRIAQAQERLSKLQYADGGWAWMDGMKANYYVTLTVSEHLARLSNYIGRHALPAASALNTAALRKMLTSGIGYLDREEAARYKETFRKEMKLLPAETTCRYLYLKTLAGSAASDASGAVATLTDDYLNRVEKHIRQLTMYGQAHMAVVLLSHGRAKSAKAFVQSLREYLVEKPGMGRYFDTRQALYSWLDYRIPTHVAAMRAVQATASLFPDTDTRSLLLDMQLWLLRQKQAQQWDNEVTTLDVCDLLLSVDSAATFRQPQLPTVRLDGQPLALAAPAAGTGYVKAAAEGQAVGATTLTVRKQTEGVSWGCAYGRSSELLDRVEASSAGELRIERTLYRRAAQADGTTGWQLLAEGEELAVGDRVRMRLRVQADRDMDFLQVRSQHAACLEPVGQLSGYQRLGGRGGYVAHHDTQTDLFFDTFTKGAATADLEFYVTRSGRYSQGIATVQSAYCPAFAAHSAGSSLVVSEAQAQ